MRHYERDAYHFRLTIGTFTSQVNNIDHLVLIAHQFLTSTLTATETVPLMHFRTNQHCTLFQIGETLWEKIFNPKIYVFFYFISFPFNSKTTK